jgi:hypothetical protein
MLLKADFDFFNRSKGINVTDSLSKEDKDDLISLAKEPFGYKTVSQKQFDEAINQWRTK